MSGSTHIMTDVDEDDWVVVSRRWWDTPYMTVSWAYNPPKTSKRLYARALHRPELLTRKNSLNSRQLGAGFHGPEEAHELELNEELVGCRGALDVLSVYEGHVGIEVSSEKPQQLDLSRKVEEVEVASHQTRWREIMENFLGELPEHTSDSSDSEGSGSPLFSSFESSRSSVSSFEVSEWERDHSMSMPSTPKPKAPVPRSGLEDWVSPRETRSCNLSPFGASPSRRLNASATAFVPQLPRPESQPAPSLTFSSDSSPKTSASSPSPPLHDFTFPSLNIPSIPKVKIEKDDQGFYSGIEEDGSGAQSKALTTLLPAFLHEESPRRKSPSRTRAIIDKLRSASSHVPLGPGDHLDRASGSESEADTDLRSSTPPFVDDGEGWISVDPSANTSENSVASRAQRKRDLFLALNKHQRSESSTLSTSTSPEHTEQPESSSITVEHRVNDDGWIESVPQAQTKKFRRRPPRKPGAAKLAELSSTLGGSAPVFPTLNSTGPGSHQIKSHPSVPSMTVLRAPAPPVPAPGPLPVPYAYGGYPVMGPVPVAYPPPYPVMQYHGPPSALHQRTPSLVPVVGYAPPGKAPFVPPPHMVPVNYPPSSGMRPTMW